MVSDGAKSAGVLRVSPVSFSCAWRAQVGRPVGELVGYRVGSDKQDKGALVVYVTVGHFLEALVHNPPGSPGNLKKHAHHSACNQWTCVGIVCWH